MTIRPATRSELEWIRLMARAEGWNPGLDDMSAFYAQDPTGWLIGEIEGEPRGCISCVRYEGNFGFVGFYIVDPSFRGFGYGIALFNAALMRLRGCTIGLDGVFDQQPNYCKKGFELAYSNIRFEYINEIVQEQSPRVSEVTPQLYPCLEAFDLQHFGYARPAFLKQWFQLPHARTMLIRKANVILAYGSIRECDKGYKIGPLFAENPELAELLFRSLCSTVAKGEYIYLDIPEPNAAGLRLAERYGMKSVFGTARMYAGNAPILPLNNIFGVTSFELG